MTSSTSPQVRVLQGGAHTVGVEVLVSGAKAQTATPFATPPYFPVTGANIHVEEVPLETTGPAIVDVMYALAASSFNPVMIVGEEVNGSLAAIALVDDHSAPPVGQIKLRLGERSQHDWPRRSLRQRCRGRVSCVANLRESGFQTLDRVPTVECREFSRVHDACWNAAVFGCARRRDAESLLELGWM
jgi:hypothetical protein